MKSVCATALIVVCLTAGVSAHAQHSTHKTEAIATVQNSYGVTSTYAVGLSFHSSEECERTLSKMHVMFQNLYLQGLNGVSGITLDCVKPKVIN
ncbi:hypothetical protein HIMB100_00012030 [SAR116 cluster alpha proteobacterium HIMB100]|nr:hypothetical protein HIMB100_00012030 [SAR116 cluster alpha proteobacterium HIMB100]